MNSHYHFCAQVIADTQRGYSVPDVELRESLKRDNKEWIHSSTSFHLNDFQKYFDSFY